LALPGETKDSHLNSLRKLFEWDVGYIICYNLLLYEGSELNSPQQREKFNLRTGFRLIDTAFGLYDNGIVSFECEEGVRSTSTMSEEEVLFFRPIHWLIQFCWNYRFYFDLLKYVKRQGVNPVEFFLELVNNINSAPDSVSKIFSEFSKEAADEWFGTTEELREYYARPENLEALRNGTFGKMNGRYIWRVVLECKEDFDAYVMQTAKKLLPLHSPVIDSLVRFSSESLLDFGDIKRWEDGRESVFDHDILRWRESKYEGCPERRESRYSFYLPQSQKDALSVLLHQYVHPNKNFTLRKISEHMRITDLFYKLDRVV
jgi:hypothetical protein